MDLLWPTPQNKLDYNNWHCWWVRRSWNLPTLFLLMRTLDNSTLVRVCRVNDIDTAEIMDQWIKEHCKGDIRILGGPTQQELDVLFELEKEAMLFKLRWL